MLVLAKPVSDADLYDLANAVLATHEPLQIALLEFARAYALSARQRQILLCGVRGLTLDETAAELGMAVRTVKEHWQRIFRRLGLHDAPHGQSQHRVLASLVHFVAQRTS